MEDRIIQFRVGVVVLAAFLIAGTLVLWFGDGIRHTYTIYLKAQNAPGVAVDTPVRKHGVRIGRVSQVDLLDDGVLLTLNIDEGRVLRTSELPRIATASLLGDAVVEFVPADEKDLPAEVHVIKNGETIVSTGAGPTGPSDVFQVVVDLQDKIESAFESVELAGQKIAQLTDSFDSIVGKNDDQMKSLLAKSDLALDQFGKAMANVNDVIGDEQLKQKIRETLVRLPVVVEEARLTLTDARTTLEGFARVGQRAERNLENLEGLTRPLGEQGDEIVATIQRSIGRVEEIMTHLVQFTQALNNPDGSLGRLVHDPELFERINMAASNIEEVTRKLKPIMNDARVLTDKLARDPSQLGVRGAISRPKGQGLKYPLIGRPPNLRSASGLPSNKAH